MAEKVSTASREERRREILALHKSGKSQRAIAASLGISRSLVQKEIREAKTEAVQAPRRTSRPAQVVKTTQLQQFGFTGGIETILPPPDHFDRWRREGMDRDTWSKATASELVSLLINISPEASRAVWDFLRLLNSGHEVKVYRPGTETPDPRGQAALDEFIGRLETYHGSLKVVMGRLFMGAITRGAFFAELVLDDTGRFPVDISTPDPATVRFQSVDDVERGTVWKPGQWQGGKFVVFETPTVRYLPLDPEPGNPYGRPMLAPAVFPAVFLIGLLHDLRRVVAQQGYPRTDIIVRLEVLRDTYGDLGMDEFEQKVDELISVVGSEYARMEPDDAFTHTDAVEVNRAGGVVDTSAMQGAVGLIEALERMATRALKTMPLLMGIGEGQSEAKANREWEVFGESLTFLQHYAETLLDTLFELALQAQGIAATVEVKFAGIRSASEFRDEQTARLRLGNAVLAEQMGYMSRDEASVYAVGHEAEGDAPDIFPGVSSASNPASAQPEPGASRSVEVRPVTNGWAVFAGERQVSGSFLKRDEADETCQTYRRILGAGEGPVRDVVSERAVRSWDRVFEGTDYAGLLESPVVEGDA